ncbi:MAG: DUF975 family protein [Streptococcaceae bacterium]|jgi:uncharacterized membrane protein|nr:DUF975 family protein [Streptococcaceae bacterium]
MTNKQLKDIAKAKLKEGRYWGIFFLAFIPSLLEFFMNFGQKFLQIKDIDIHKLLNANNLDDFFHVLNTATTSSAGSNFSMVISLVVGILSVSALGAILTLLRDQPGEHSPIQLWIKKIKPPYFVPSLLTYVMVTLFMILWTLASVGIFVVFILLAVTIGIIHQSSLGLSTLVVLVLLLLCALLPIYKGIQYSQAVFCAYDQVDEQGKLSKATAALNESKTLMKGQILRYALLHLSFFGWYLLVGLTFGIALFFLKPYITATTIAYYHELKAAE